MSTDNPPIVINPATGLPMIDNNIHGVDVQGNAYGFGASETPPIDWGSSDDLFGSVGFDSSFDSFD
jgi:hypothetical protein